MNHKPILKGVEYQEEPYSQSNKFSVFIPKHESEEAHLQQPQPQPQPQQQHFHTQSLEGPPLNHQNAPTQDYLSSTSPHLHPDKTQKYHVRVNVQPQRNVTQNRYRHTQQTPLPQKNTAYLQNLMKQKTLQNFRESLYFDERINKVPKSTVRNAIIDSIVGDADLLLNKKPLLDSIYKLKQLNLLRSKDFNQTRLPGVGKSSFVYNDYHTKSTNNGYSRNFGGVFYTR